MENKEMKLGEAFLKVIGYLLAIVVAAVMILSMIGVI